uniref:Uncharacterized protein n=1 Tax=Arundo donax TaxID=35708 RepID=A0A0A9H7X7_ARUDO
MIFHPLLTLNNDLMFVFLLVHLTLYIVVFFSHEREQ